jgi:hypothetical protein
MRTVQYDPQELVKLLRKRKIATMPELKAALETQVDSTVFRKLRELKYRTSYSHRGSYYTLDRIARFDARGLWSFRSVLFSRYGTLVSTVEGFVDDSEAGYFVGELDNELGVGVKEPLLRLVRAGRIAREKVSGLYLYCSSNRARRKQQTRARKTEMAEQGEMRSIAVSAMLLDELKAALVLFFSLLDEKQRRLYAGLESLKYGHGGDRRIAGLLGVDVSTVARGRGELLMRDVELERVRKPGAGRKPLEKKRQKSSLPSRS